jgi:hypothetical protein
MLAERRILLHRDHCELCNKLVMLFMGKINKRLPSAFYRVISATGYYHG